MITSRNKLPLPLAGEGWGEGTSFARLLRKNATDAEACLWHHLRARQLGGFKFRRQHSFGPYILDFFCAEKKIAIECDGGQHLENAAHDRARDVYLLNNGVRTLRFWNDQVLTQTEEVLAVIWEQLHPPHPNPLPSGEGDETLALRPGEGDEIPSETGDKTLAH